MIVNATKDTIQQCDQSEKGNQHGSNIQGEMKAVDCAPGNRSENIFIFGHGLAVYVCYRRGDLISVWPFMRRCKRLFSFRHEHLCQQDGTGGSDEKGPEQVLCFEPLR